MRSNGNFMGKKNHLAKYFLWMLGCSMVAMLLNPLVYIDACFCGGFIYKEEPLLAIFYILSYTIIGSLIWFLLRNKKWSTQALFLWLATSVVLLALLIFWLKIIKDGMTALMILTSFLVGEFLSSIPIWLSCRYNQIRDKQMQ